ncbi:glycoside hydrolase family 5 protein [Ideonella sp.]|uniref:glycoside hydrolase family 5 protein n=1 Tax=Ideonella sp. TaxID=1929293 RepID=UPI002B45F1CE|nr:cellulase family glycosylhydrolase [Ideonella sp.]HJV71824.1 cellulase family glycosylhydrolase [Ideonella sp.]
MAARRWAHALLAAGALAAALGSAARAEPAAAGMLGVQAGGSQLLRDCKPWVPRGLSFFGRLVPRGHPADPSTAAAQERFDAEALRLARAVGADVVRLQIGQPFLDPQSPQHDPAYLGEVKDAAAQARRAGFSVILSLQWEGRTGVKPVEMLPKASALRAWAAVAPAFADDLGVAFELFNEPASPPDPGPGFWEAWRAGHQALIDTLRRQGVRNLLIVDGLRGGQRLDGAPPLADPIGQLAYAVHPYFGNEDNSPAGWDQRFGRFASTHPVIATEWGHAAQHCERGGADRVEQLIGYLAERHIGLVAYGSDERHSRLLHWDGERPVWSSYRGRPCAGARAGPGELLQALFERQAREAARAEAVAPARCERPPLPH